MNIGENIRLLRQAHKMEQRDLADRLHISDKTISSWECGRTEPKMGMIEEMAEIFGISKCEIIEGPGPVQKSQNYDFFQDPHFVDYVLKMWSLSRKRLDFIYELIDFQVNCEKEDERKKEDSSLA